MPADDAGAVGEPVGMHYTRRAQQQSRRIDRAGADDDEVGPVGLNDTVAADDDLPRFAAGDAGFDALDIGVGQQAHSGVAAPA